jgi:type I restriction enzyme R subunit
MSEYGYVEQPILNWLCGESRVSYHVGGLGWTYRDEAAMAEFGRPLEDPLVETLLKEAIVRINPHVETETQARRAVEALRKAMGQPDRLGANRATLDLLRDGVRVVLRPGEDARTVHFIAFEAERQHLNDFTATNQYRVQGVKQCRDDTVLLVNGIPLVVAEYKSYVTRGNDWREAVHQLHRYQRQASLMLAPNSLLCGGRRGRIPLRDSAVSRRQQGGH